MELLKVANRFEDKLNKKADYHVALDVLGLIPGVGEVFDAANALSYATEGNWLYSILSIISMLPEIGDLIGKSPKLIVALEKMIAKGGPKAEKAAKFIVKHKDDVLNAIRKIRNLFKANKTEIMEKIEKFINEHEDIKEKYSNKFYKIKLELDNIEDILDQSDSFIEKLDIEKD